MTLHQLPEPGPRRDPSRQRAMLEPRGEFAQHALSRLEDGDDAFGDRWTLYGVERFVHELHEEAADIGGWAALAEQALELDAGLDAAARERLTRQLQHIINAGEHAYHLIGILGQVLAEARTLHARLETDGG